MRIALVYPPPWKIPEPGQAPDPRGEGPPKGFQPTDLDADFFQMPYGMLTLAAMVRKAGHQAKVVNLSGFSWPRTQRALDQLDADVYGLTCFTANRRGVAIVARAIKRLHPGSYVIVGGPHATALPREMLSFVDHIDSVVLGEGELTLVELLDRLAQGRSFDGLAGLAWRGPSGIVQGPSRERIRNLDQLPSPHHHFRTHLLMTSRGCPGECTFCAKNTTWGRLYRAHSVPYVVDSIEAALGKLPVKMILVKDDTFTTDRRRAIRICEAIRERKLQLRWSCDTRADVIDEDVLRAMRWAGCERLSLGVESGSPAILRNIHKRVKLEDVIRATDLAKKVGLQVRYFMMLGNRGETRKTFRESLEFVRRAQPHQAIFACLSIYPGTEDFRTLQRQGRIDGDLYFTDDFQELKEPFDASDQDTDLMAAWFDQNRGIRHLHVPTVRECQRVIEDFQDLPGAHLDLAGAYYREGAWDEAERCVRRALDLEYPSPGLAHNYLACIAAERGDIAGMQAHFNHAASDPQHPVLVRNVQLARKWVREGGARDGRPPGLVAHHDFDLLERTEQPALPGPLAPDFAEW